MVLGGVQQPCADENRDEATHHRHYLHRRLSIPVLWCHNAIATVQQIGVRDSVLTTCDSSPDNL